MNFVKMLKKKRYARLILDSDWVLISKDEQKLIKVKGILKDYIHEEENTIELEVPFLYYIGNFREKTLKEQTGDIEVIPFIICYPKWLYKLRTKLKEKLFYYNINKVIIKIFLEKIKRLRVNELIIDNSIRMVYTGNLRS